MAVEMSYNASVQCK